MHISLKWRLLEHQRHVTLLANNVGMEPFVTSRYTPWDNVKPAPTQLVKLPAVSGRLLLVFATTATASPKKDYRSLKRETRNRIQVDAFRMASWLTATHAPEPWSRAFINWHLSIPRLQALSGLAGPCLPPLRQGGNTFPFMSSGGHPAVASRRSRVADELAMQVGS